MSAHSPRPLAPSPESRARHQRRFRSPSNAHLLLTRSYDRLSDIDQRSPHYGKPNSFLRPRTKGIPSHFQRKTHQQFNAAVAIAANIKDKKNRELSLTGVGLNVSAFEFDDKGGYSFNFALAQKYIPFYDHIDGAPTDKMHTSYQGTAPQEGYLFIYYCIRIQEWFTRLELVKACQEADLPKGVSIPVLRKYVEEGIKGGMPKPSGKLKFTASQSRHWVEHSRQIFEAIFCEKVSSCCKLTPLLADGSRSGTPCLSSVPCRHGRD